MRLATPRAHCGRRPGGHPAHWPMIVLRTPKGWTGPKEVDGLPVEGTWRAHQVPLAETRSNAEHREQLEQWMRSYRPEELFDEAGPADPGPAGARAAGAAADERQPARQRRAAAARPGHAGLPRLRRAGGPPRRRVQRGDPGAGHVPARHHRPQPGPVPPDGPGRDGVQPAHGRVRGDRPGLGRDHPAR